MTTATALGPSGKASSSGLEERSFQSLPLGEQLVHRGLLTVTELEAALAEQSAGKRRLGEILCELGFVEEEELLPYLGKQLGLEAVRLRDGLVDPAAVHAIPRAVAEAYAVLALFRVRGTLTVAMADPQDLWQIDELARITHLEIRPVLALRSAIERMLARCYGEDFVVDAVTADVAQDAVVLDGEAVTVSLTALETMADESPIINLVNYLIVHAVRQGASDIHIEAGHRHSTVRFRIDGQLREVLRPRRDFHPAIVSRIKVVSKMDIAEHRLPQDGRVNVVVEGREIDLRVSTLPTVLGEKVVLRILDRQNVTFDLDALGVSPHVLSVVKRMLARPAGLVLVTGPTGSGKTTTLYSAIELLKSVHRNIVTVEDPVEYQLSLINQVQVSANASLTFASALRSILRQDPDIVMVGEIRDAETAEVSLQAALTGHLVLSTLHTNDSASAVIRLRDMGLPSYKIAAALAGVIAQRLVRRVCPSCRAAYYPPAEQLAMIHYSSDKPRQFVRGAGCAQCFDSGFKGRTGIYEVLSVTPELRQIIARDSDLDVIRESHRRQGGTMLLEEGIRLAETGQTSLDEVIGEAFFD
jgi:type IV pilus assembly protein PilB